MWLKHIIIFRSEPLRFGLWSSCRLSAAVAFLLRLYAQRDLRRPLQWTRDLQDLCNFRGEDGRTVEELRERCTEYDRILSKFLNLSVPSSQIWSDRNGFPIFSLEVSSPTPAAACPFGSFMASICILRDLTEIHRQDGTQLGLNLHRHRSQLESARVMLTYHDTSIVKFF